MTRQQQREVKHGKIAREDMLRAFKRFTTIPDDQKVTPAENQILLKEITEDEVLEAIHRLNRHKAAGTDRMSNGSFKDIPALLVPALTRTANGILQGESLLILFEALIIPLRKKGDSEDAMNYRPISLLQCGYKGFAKIQATRLKEII